MKLLALDSSGLVASVAIVTEDTVLAEYTLNYKKTHSQTLLPMLSEIIEMTGQDLSGFDAIAVASGPGSFTGLRIGSSTAKGLGFALNIPLVPVPTLEGLACQYAGTKDAVICPMMDARRKQVYTAVYDWKEEESPVVLAEQRACPIDEILHMINELGRPVIFLGDGVPVSMEQIREMVQVPYRIAPPHMARQRAAAVGFRALALFAEGKTETAADHVPKYLRKSQAERELIEGGGHLPEDDS